MGIATQKRSGDGAKAPAVSRGDYTRYSRLDNRITEYEKWYKNPSMSDVTILYGPHGERKFAGHRFVFTNTAELIFKSESPILVSES